MGFVPKMIKLNQLRLPLHPNMYTNNINATGQAGFIITNLADHFGTIYLTKSHKTNNSHVNKTRKSIFSHSTIEIFRNKLKHFYSIDISLIMCPNEAYNINFMILINNFRSLKYHLKPNSQKLTMVQAWS